VKPSPPVQASPPTPAPPTTDELEWGLRLAELKEATAKARRALDKGEEGRKGLLRDIQEGLITAMYLEKQAGEKPKDAGKSTEANARQSRKQFKELAELVMDVVLEVDHGS
jgi:hypothetical protein